MNLMIFFQAEVIAYSGKLWILTYGRFLLLNAAKWTYFLNFLENKPKAEIGNLNETNITRSN